MDPCTHPAPKAAGIISIAAGIRELLQPVVEVNGGGTSPLGGAILSFNNFHSDI